jgi:hypothetical protein
LIFPLHPETEPAREAVITIESDIGKGVRLIVERDVLPYDLCLRFDGPALRQRDRVTALQRRGKARAVDIDADIAFGGRIAAEPRSHQDAVQIPSTRADMRPVAAEARRI